MQVLPTFSGNIPAPPSDCAVRSCHTLYIPAFVNDSHSRTTSSRTTLPAPIRKILAAGGLVTLAVVVATRAKVVPVSESASTERAATTVSAASTAALPQELAAASAAVQPAPLTPSRSLPTASAGRRAVPRNVYAAPRRASTFPTTTIDAEFFATTRSQLPQFIGATVPQSGIRSTAVASSVELRSERNSPRIRDLVSHSGVTLSATAINDASSGYGVTAGARALRSYTQLELNLDLDSLFGWHALTFSAHHDYKHGKDGSGEAGFVQSFSNIDAEDFSIVGEVFLEQQLMDGRFRFKVGRLDFTTEFATVDNSGDFLNSSMEYSPSITGAPTYQASSTAINAIVQLTPNLSLLGGVFDGAAGAPAPGGGSSRFAVVQANQQWSMGQRDLPGRFGVGMFRHTGLFAAANADGAASESDVRGVTGWYATLDQVLWRGNARSADAEDDRPAIAAFAQFGKSDPRASGVNSHAGGGMTFSGFIPHAGSNVIGIGGTRARWEEGRESVRELFVKQPLFARLALEFDVQGVDRLSFNGDHQHGRVYMMRTVVTF